MKDIYKYMDLRDEIRVRRYVQRLSKPWTNDPILKEWKFCNVDRDDDKSSQWLIHNWRDKYQDDSKEVLWRIMLFRWWNIPETGDTLVKHNLDSKWDYNLAVTEISKQVKYGTAAYRIKGPTTGNKVTSISSVLDDFHKNLDKIHNDLVAAGNWEDAYSVLRAIPYFGIFNTYQFFLDMMKTRSWVNHLGDPKHWCKCGPGAMRGLNRLRSRKIDYKMKQDDAYMEIHQLWQRRPARWKHLWVCDIQHNLCELDKYNRVLDGGRMKVKYNGNP